MTFPDPIRSAYERVRAALGASGDKGKSTTKKRHDLSAARERVKAAASVLADEDTDQGKRTKALKAWREAKDEVELLEMVVASSQEKAVQSQAVVEAQKKTMAAAWKSYCDSRIAGAYAAIETANLQYNEASEEAYALGLALNDHGLIFMQKRTVLPLRGSTVNQFQPTGEQWHAVIREIADTRAAVMAVLNAKGETS